MRLTPIVKGAATYIPGLYKMRAKRRTGGTDTAAYCYDVWLKHLTLLWANGLRTIPDTIAELGPGDSLGTGLAALLSGVNHYYALDVMHYANMPRNLLIFEQLVTLFQQHAGRPTKGWPDYDQYLDANLFPSHILTASVLEMTLAPDRLAAIRAALVHPSPDADGRSYGFGDWAKPNKALKRPLTQASLRCTRWLKPSSLHRIPTPLKRCWMSHLQALSTIPDPRGNPSSLYLA